MFAGHDFPIAALPDTVDIAIVFCDSEFKFCSAVDSVPSAGRKIQQQNAGVVVCNIDGKCGVCYFVNITENSQIITFFTFEENLNLFAAANCRNRTR